MRSHAQEMHLNTNKRAIQTLFILQQLQNRYIQLILIMRVGTNVCVCVVFVWENWNGIVKI